MRLTTPHFMPNIFKKVFPILYKLQGFCGAEVNTMLTTNKKQWTDEYGYTEYPTEVPYHKIMILKRIFYLLFFLAF